MSATDFLALPRRTGFFLAAAFLRAGAFLAAALRAGFLADFFFAAMLFSGLLRLADVEEWGDSTANSPSVGMIVAAKGWSSQRGNAEFRQEIGFLARILFAVLLSLLLFVAQSSAPLPGVFVPAEGSIDESILRRFATFSPEEQERISQEALYAARELDHPLAAKARAILADQAAVKLKRVVREDAPLWNAKTYAPALKLKNKELDRKNSKWKTLASHCFGKSMPLPQDKRWVWDDGQEVLRAPSVNDPAEVLLALLNGRLDPLGEVEAVTEAMLDDRSRKASAFYFDHVYRDRDGNYYPGILLSDIWGSSTTFGISDADAIAWMHTVASDRSLVSPIATKDQRPLYKRLEDDYVALRDARNLRRALAARLVEPLGNPPALLEGVIEQIDLAWRLQDHDPAKMAAFLKRYAQRQVFFAAVRQLDTARQHQSYEEEKTARQELPFLVRQNTLDFLADEGLLGFRRR